MCMQRVSVRVQSGDVTMQHDFDRRGKKKYIYIVCQKWILFEQFVETTNYNDQLMCHSCSKVHGCSAVCGARYRKCSELFQLIFFRH